MFSRTLINTCLQNLVGFRQNLNPCLAPLPTNLIVDTANGGLAIEDAHGLLTLENISDTLEDVGAYQYEIYVLASVFNINQLVIDSTTQNIYRSLVVNNTNNALTDPLFWQLVGLKPTYINQLQAIYDNGIQKTLNEVFALKTSIKDEQGNPYNLSGVAKSLLSNQSLYEVPNNSTNTDTKNSRFVAVAINLQRRLNIQVQIPQIGLHLTQSQTLPIYIYHTSQKQAIAQFDVIYTNANSFQWIAIDTQIFNYRSDFGDGGTYYVGYYQDDLIGTSIRYNVEFSNCSTCGGGTNYHYQSYQCLAKYQSYIQEPQFFYFDFADLNGIDIPNINKRQRIHSSNFGLNLKVNVYCDVTTMICENKLQFQNLLQLQIAYDLLDRILMNTRNNRIAEITKQNALYELKGLENPNSLAKQIERQRQGINFNFSNLDPICLPCGTRGVKTKIM
jgi:hypothetical protein